MLGGTNRKSAVKNGSNLEEKVVAKVEKQNGGEIKRILKCFSFSRQKIDGCKG